MLFTSTIWTYCFHQPDITNRVCLLAPFIMQYLGLLHFVQVIKNCRHGRRSKANFLFVSNEIIRCLLCVWTTALPQYQWERCAYFSRTTNSLFCLLVTRMAKVKKSGYIYFLHRLPSWLRIRFLAYRSLRWDISCIQTAFFRYSYEIISHY